jgi:hypothetical protein
MLFKNVASQKALVFAYDKTSGAAKTGDAANITASVSKDGAAPAGSNDTNPTEIGGGWYAFDLTQAETNCDLFLLYAASTTANILVTGVSGYTTGGSIPQAGVAAAATALTNATWTDARAAKLDNADVATSTRLASADYTAPANADITAIKAKTDNLPAAPAATGDIPTAVAIRSEIDSNSTKLDAAVSTRLAAASYTAPPSAAANADELLDRANAIETGWTVRKALRIIAAACAGKVSGAAANAPVFRSITDGKNRITATTDADGNRSAVTLDGD